MFRLINRRVLGAATVVAGLVAVVMWPKTAQVDIAAVSFGPLVVTVDEEGVTRVRDRFIVSAPVSGRVLRIELDPGDRVTRGQVVARVRAEAPPLLDARTRAEAAATVESARAALGRARAEEQRAKATLDQTRRDLARLRPLAEGRVIANQELETHEADVDVAQETANAAAFAVRAATSELQRASPRRSKVSCSSGFEKARRSCRQATRSSRSATSEVWKSWPTCCRPTRFARRLVPEPSSSNGAARSRWRPESDGSSRQAS